MRSSKHSVFASIAAVALVWGVAPHASANDRHFGWSYESATLPEGSRELEVWNTYRTGRSRFFTQMDHRIEFEIGLTNRLQTAFYINFSGVAEDDALGKRTRSFDYRGVSNEWKFRVSDAVADPIGFAIYGELAFAPEVFAMEAKLIFDKRIGNLLLASNLIVEPEFERAVAGKESEVEFELGATLGATYFVRPNLALGFEGRVETKMTDEAAAGAGAYVGPVIAWSTRDFWTTFTLQRQLPALRKEGSGARYLQEGHELYQARVLFAFHL